MLDYNLEGLNVNHAEIRSHNGIAIKKVFQVQHKEIVYSETEAEIC